MGPMAGDAGRACTRADQPWFCSTPEVLHFIIIQYGSIGFINLISLLETAREGCAWFSARALISCNNFLLSSEDLHLVTQIQVEKAHPSRVLQWLGPATSSGSPVVTETQHVSQMWSYTIISYLYTLLHSSPRIHLRVPVDQPGWLDHYL